MKEEFRTGLFTCVVLKGIAPFLGHFHQDETISAFQNELGLLLLLFTKPARHGLPNWCTATGRRSKCTKASVFFSNTSFASDNYTVCTSEM